MHPHLWHALLIVGGFYGLLVVAWHLRHGRAKPKQTPEPHRGSYRDPDLVAQLRVVKAENGELADKLRYMKFERDLARQQLALARLGRQARTGGLVALGALGCFVAMHAPSLVREWTSDEPDQVIPDREPAPRHETRRASLLTMAPNLRFSLWCERLSCRFDAPFRLSIYGGGARLLEQCREKLDLAWIRIVTFKPYLMTSGGENPLVYVTEEGLETALAMAGARGPDPPFAVDTRY